MEVVPSFKISKSIFYLKFFSKSIRPSFAQINSSRFEFCMNKKNVTVLLSLWQPAQNGHVNRTPLRACLCCAARPPAVPASPTPLPVPVPLPPIVHSRPPSLLLHASMNRLASSSSCTEDPQGAAMAIFPPSSIVRLELPSLLFLRRRAVGNLRGSPNVWNTSPSHHPSPKPVAVPPRPVRTNALPSPRFHGETPPAKACPTQCPFFSSSLTTGPTASSRLYRYRPPHRLHSRWPPLARASRGAMGRPSRVAAWLGRPVEATSPFQPARRDGLHDQLGRGRGLESAHHSI
jgi:hypothetical protein